MDHQEEISKLHERVDQTVSDVADIGKKIAQHDVILNSVQAATDAQTAILKEMRDSFSGEVGRLNRAHAESQRFPYGVFWSGGAVLIVVIAGLYALASKPDELRLGMIESELVRRDQKFEKLEDQNQMNAAEFANLRADVGSLKTNAATRHEAMQIRITEIDSKTRERFTKADGQRHSDEICELQSTVSRLLGKLEAKE